MQTKTVRRNARERNRVKQIDVGFEKLRTTIPTAANQKKIQLYYFPINIFESTGEFN